MDLDFPYITSKIGLGPIVALDSDYEPQTLATGRARQKSQGIRKAKFFAALIFTESENVLSCRFTDARKHG